ncbi:MAG: hypothetical protein AAF743_06220 [Planctomycetota bacterium]
MQRQLLTTALAAVGSLTLVAAAHAGSPNLIVSDFDTGLDGWTAVGLDAQPVIFPSLGVDFTIVDNAADMAFSATGGNPGGYAELTDAIEDPASFAAAPTSFLGDGNLSSFVGGTLSFDHALFDAGPNSGILPRAVVIASGDLDDLNALVWIGDIPTPGPDWQSFELGFDTVANGGSFIPVGQLDIGELGDLAGFDLPVSGPVDDFLTTGTLTPAQIFADVDLLLLPFETVDNDSQQNLEDAGLDNVVLAIPEPGSLGIAALGGLMLRRRR